MGMQMFWKCFLTSVGYRAICILTVTLILAPMSEVVATPNEGYVAYEKGEALYRARNYAAAFKEFKWVIENAQDDYPLDGVWSMLGRMYETGLGVQRSRPEAIRAFKMAALMGDSFAQNLQNVLYLDDSVDIFECQNSLTKLWYAAEDGDSGAQYVLGSIYYEGIGVPPDRSKAMLWLGKAANAHIPQAMYLPGTLYRTGDGIMRDKEKAAYWLGKAADSGKSNAPATLRVPRDYALEDDRLSQSKQVKRFTCAPSKKYQQKGFEYSNYLPAYLDFRRRLMVDTRALAVRYVEWLSDSKFNEQATLRNVQHWIETDSDSLKSTFAQSIDDGVLGQALKQEIIGVIAGRDYGVVSPMKVMLQQVIKNACPVGFGGTFVDRGKNVELWYVDLDDTNAMQAFAKPRLPAFGTIERDMFPALIFVRDATGKLRWYGISREMGIIMSHWYNIQIM